MGPPNHGKRFLVSKASAPTPDHKPVKLQKRVDNSLYSCNYCLVPEATVGGTVDFKKIGEHFVHVYARGELEGKLTVGCVEKIYDDSLQEDDLLEALDDLLNEPTN